MLRSRGRGARGGRILGGDESNRGRGDRGRKRRTCATRRRLCRREIEGWGERERGLGLEGRTSYDWEA